jgi:hypothetical protein
MRFTHRIRFNSCHADLMTCGFLKNGRADLNGVVLEWD